MFATLSYRLFALLLLSMVFEVSAVELQTFSSEQLRDRYLVLIDDLRCPQCQNQNLSDSDSPIAQDLRRTVLRMLENGNTDKEILDYLIDRYGDFITYMPRFQRTTYALWLTPLLLAVFGVGFLLWIVRRQRAGRSNDSSSMGEPVLDSTERHRLDELLSHSGSNREQDN